MLIQIRVPGDSDQELISFHAWLVAEPDVRQHARILLVPSEPARGHMGTAFEVIQLITDSGFQAANLALAYLGWRATRPRGTRVTIQNGTTAITLDNADPRTVEAVVDALNPESGRDDLT